MPTEGHFNVGRGIPFESSFALGDAAVDLNFVTGRYWNGFIDSSDPNAFLTCLRASIGTDLLPTSAQGASFTTFPADTLRITPGVGLLIGEQRTNVLLASGVPATQVVTLGTGDFTLWVNGSGSATSSAGTAVGSGFDAATQGAPNTFNLSVGGTVVVTVAGLLNQFQLENGAFATSYIPTTIIPVTREADNVQSSGAGNAGLVDRRWRAPIGSIVIYCNLSGMIPTGGSPRFIQDANDAAEMSVNDITNTTVYILRDGTGDNVAVTTDTLTLGVTTKVGGSWPVDVAEAMGIVLNGGTVEGNAEGAAATTASPTNIGNRASDFQRSISGHIERIVLWNTQLPDATLQGHTA